VLNARAGSACLNAGLVLSGEPWESAMPELMYARHRGSIPRPKEGLPDLGAFEGAGGGTGVIRMGRKAGMEGKRGGRPFDLRGRRLIGTDGIGLGFIGTE
jgi:hypothetical protein